jgi:hypothetical protein
MWEISMRKIKVAEGQNHRSEPVPLSNYSSAIARAIEWLGDRYLLANPINAAPANHAAAVGTPGDALKRPRSR